ncbi:SLAP domain-containing protein [Virgibacillus kimchii]
MNELVFEKAWDKTISETDRMVIKKAFQEADLADTPSIQFSPLWQKTNYKGELLITVIIHNISQIAFSFASQTLYYKTGEKIAAEHTFHLPFSVKAKTSMPWTFIFPEETVRTSHHLENGKLRLTKSYAPH